MSMTHGTNGNKANEEPQPPRPPSARSGTSSGSGSSKHVKCIGRYVLTGDTLGKGNFARVEAAVHTLTRAKVAVKIIEIDKIKEDYVRKNLLREAQLMRRLRHPNIIRLYETMKTNNLYCLVTEIAEGGELLSHVRNDFKEKRLSEATTRPFIRQLVSALHHLHNVGIVHRDLKMENILLDKKKRNVKIVDFGLSNAAKPGSLLQTHCGSPEYAAPELFVPGREYGPEVDVWSLGVNMYAMLVGKLPFRSPRQGTKRRQKLLEQITAGLSESHEKELVHVSRGAHDLINQLLQPDPRRRASLDEVMVHSWITKDGTQPLHPFKYIPPDSMTQASVIELMSTVLEVSQSEIKETARRDRCDWLAAIYNLLHDQPEGRTILQRLITDDPEDQLVDAAHYQGSMEHLRLSQGEMLDQIPPEVASILTSAVAEVKKSGYRHSLSQPQAHLENGDYASSTLPLTKRERKRHHSTEPRTLGAPRNLGPVHPPPGIMLRRSSVASPYSSPEHPIQQQQQQQLLTPSQPVQHSHHSHHGHGQSHGGHIRRKLPVTPNEEPYQRTTEPMRAHSRAESAPDPLPIPWRPKITHRNQLVLSPQARSPNSSPPPQQRVQLEEPKVYQYTNYKDQLVSPLSQIKPAKMKGGLNPVRPKSMALPRNMAGSMDTNLHLTAASITQPGSHTLSGHSMWNQRQQVAPVEKGRRRSEGVHTQGGGAAQLGWASVNRIDRVQRLGQAADIQAMMRKDLPSSPYNSMRDIPAELHKLQTSPGAGSATSVELSHELFNPHQPGQDASPLGSKGPSPQGSKGPSPQASKAYVQQSRENLRVDPISGGELHVSPQHHYPYHYQQPKNHQQQVHRHRSASAKPLKRTGFPMANHMSSSMGYVGPGADLQRNGHVYHKQDDLPDLDDMKGKNGRKSSIGSFLGKAFKLKNSKEKSASTTLFPKPL